jgi:hypothetical protein
MKGVMGFFCKVQCEKCGKIMNDFRGSEIDTFTVEIHAPTMSTKEVQGEYK